MEVLSWWSMLFCCKRYAPKESRSVMYWSIGRWIPHMDKKEQQLAIQKKQLPARSCCLSPCSATESKPLDQKVFWKESIRLAKINRLGFGKVWGSFFFFESAVWFKHSLIIWNFKFYWEAHISFRDIWKTISVTVTSLPWLFGCLGFPGFSHCQVVSVQQDKSEGS